MSFYQLPNKLDWYDDLVHTCEQKGLTLKLVCKVAGTNYEGLKRSAALMRIGRTNVGMSYEILQKLTDTLNGMEGTKG